MIDRKIRQCFTVLLWSTICSVAMMIRTALLLTSIASAAGCDAISRTEIVVRQGASTSDASSEFAADVIRVSRVTATQFGLTEVERREADVSFSDKVAGQNPGRWLTVKHSDDPVAVEIAEMYIATPTDKHRQLADALVQNLVAEGLNAKVIYQTGKSYAWYWVLVVIVLVFGVVSWRAMRRRGSSFGTPDPRTARLPS
jgi:hypothetical protein